MDINGSALFFVCKENKQKDFIQQFFSSVSVFGACSWEYPDGLHVGWTIPLKCEQQKCLIFVKNISLFILPPNSVAILNIDVIKCFPQHNLWRLGLNHLRRQQFMLYPDEQGSE